MRCPITDRPLFRFRHLVKSLAALTIGISGLGGVGIAQSPPIKSLPPAVKNPPTPATRPAIEPKITTVSGAAEIKFAEYLAANDVVFYGAYWCSHCQEQKSLFGAAAARKLKYIECAADGQNSQRQLCKDINIQMFPTWEYQGQFLPGTRDLRELAKATGYTGPLKFKYRKK